jgi:hypothetical protein
MHLGQQDADLLEAGPTFELDGIGLNPAQHGYTIVHNYALYFWRPYLGSTAFALWELLLSFCYGDTDIAYPSISRLARMLTNSDHSRAVVMGRRNAKASAARMEAKERYPGALEVLRRERLVQVFCRGHGPTARYTFRVLKTLPLLRPDQVARLSPRLQRDHAAWLERYGIDGPIPRQASDCDVCPPAQQEEPSPAVPVITPADGDSSGEAQRNTGQACSSTNNTQEELFTRWWKEAVQEMGSQLDRGLFQVCLVDAQACSFQDGLLTVRAPDAAVRRMLERRLLMLVRHTLIAVSDGQVERVCFTSADSD